MDVVCAVDLGVQVDNRSPTIQTTVSSDLSRSNPVVGATGTRSLGKLDRYQ